MMGLVSCDAEGLTIKQKLGYLGLNGSATYACSFHDVFVPNEWILAEDAALFIEKIRFPFIAYQIPLGLGLIEASITSIEKVASRQNGCNQFLFVQANDLRTSIEQIRKEIDALFAKDIWDWKEIARIRLKTVYVTLEAVQTSMLHSGSPGYLMNSGPARRLREAYFSPI